MLVYKTLIEANATGIDNVLVYVASNEPYFTPMILFGFFMVIFLGSYFGMRRAYEQANFFASFGVASFANVILAILLTLKPGLITINQLMVCIGIAVLGIIGILFFMNRRE